MKILFVQPAKPESSIAGDDYDVFEPLALEYAAAVVKDEHQVEIIDMRLDRNLGKLLKDYGPDLVALTAYTVHVNVCLEICRTVKAHNPEATTVIGGHHATIAPGDFLRHDCVDYLVLGDGIFTFKELVRRCEDKRGVDDLDGIAFVDDGQAVVRNDGPPASLDDFPLPYRKLTERYRKKYFCGWMKPLATMRTSKGCPFRCNFCALWKISGGRYFQREPERIVEELMTIDEDYVFFSDDESMVNAARMQKLADLIREKGIRKKYFLYGRSDTIVKHPEVFEQWKEIGLDRVFVGLEFFRDDDLNYINKKTTVEKNIAAVKILQDLGIEIYASCIVRPEFDREDFRDYAAFCRELDMNFVGFAVLTPLPGTDLYAELEDRLVTSRPEHFDLFHTMIEPKLGYEEFYKELHGLYRKATSFRNAISYINNFPLRERLQVALKGEKLMKRIRNVYRDYQV